MELINNTTKTLKDDLSVEIKQGSKVSIAAACFSIYAFQELKEQLSQIEQLRFIFTSPTFVTEKAKKERREFYIPRMTRERSLYGTEFEIKLRNELTQKAIARECAEWIRQKVTFKSNVSDKSIQGQIVVDSVGYTPINNFTTVELGCEKGNVISTTIVKDESLARTLLADFNEIWNDSKVLQVVTDEVIDSITAAYNENSPDFIYFVTLYNIFNEFLEDVSEDVLPNEATGFKESKIWGMLYNFQKDAALAIINKLEKYNGCILADSVGLGKTFTALAVIKYYENRNKSVLVLCPKKLTNNWNTYKDNYVNNPIAADRLRYDVLYHTDLNRTHGTSNGLDLDRLNWGNYDLVVIDESHNFRNGGKLVENPDEDAKDNRYVTLMKKVIRAGVKTKVLMLSATPVNNRFNDLKNQLALAYEGHMFKNNPEEFITKVIRLINEQKATMIVEHISYDTIEGEYDSSIFTAEKATQSFDKAFLAKKAIQDYVFTDGSADKSIERKFAEDLDAADEVCVYAKLPRTFQIPTPVGNYSPDWAIAFYEGKVKHIFFIAETKGTMESLELRPIEQAKISCAKKLFNEMSTSNVVYHDVDSYQSLLNIMNSL